MFLTDRCRWPRVCCHSCIFLSLMQRGTGRNGFYHKATRCRHCLSFAFFVRRQTASSVAMEVWALVWNEWVECSFGFTRGQRRVDSNVSDLIGRSRHVTNKAFSLDKDAMNHSFSKVSFQMQLWSVLVSFNQIVPRFRAVTGGPVRLLHWCACTSVELRLWNNEKRTSVSEEKSFSEENHQTGFNGCFFFFHERSCHLLCMHLHANGRLPCGISETRQTLRVERLETFYKKMSFILKSCANSESDTNREKGSFVFPSSLLFHTTLAFQRNQQVTSRRDCPRANFYCRRLHERLKDAMNRLQNMTVA